jgi:hypothetical protein
MSVTERNQSPLAVRYRTMPTMGVGRCGALRSLREQITRYGQSAYRVALARDATKIIVHGTDFVV